VGIFFPFMQKQLHNYSFLPFAVWLAGTLLVGIFFVPETRGRTPADVLRFYNKHAAGNLQGGSTMLV
jgi:hypothetical protein